MPIVDPDPAGVGTYLVSAVLLALGIAIFLSILFGEARANREQEQGHPRCANRQMVRSTCWLAAVIRGAGFVAVATNPSVIESCINPPFAHRGSCAGSSHSARQQ
jgi:hypothetical protein